MEANWIPINEEEDSDSDQCEVDMIIGDKKIKSGRTYCVKWKGFSNDFNQWVPKKDLNCPQKLQLYKKNKRIKKATKKVIEKDLGEEIIAVQRRYKDQDKYINYFTVRDKKTNTNTIYSEQEMRENHLSTLLNFYESNIVFTEKEIIPKINILPY